MTLHGMRDRVALAHVGVSIAAVAWGRAVSTPALLIAVALIAFAYTRPAFTPTRRSQTAWTAVVFVAMVASLWRAFARAEFLEAGVDFLLLLVVQRAFFRARAREHYQLLLLSALLMVIGSVVNVGLNYPILLAVYLLVVTLGLMLTHLSAEGERLGARVAFAMEREARTSTWPLLRAASGSATVAACGALLVFVVFPRFGVGVFLRGSLPGQTRSGFSERVSLGEFGTIKDDATVIMRIRPQAPTDVDQLEWYMRGSSFDHYEGGQWSHGEHAERVALQARGRFERFVTPIGRKHRPANSLGTTRARVTLEDIGADVLFVASEPHAVGIHTRSYFEQRRVNVFSGQNGELRVHKLPGPLMYDFLAYLDRPSAAELASVGDGDPSPAGPQPYLQRPAFSPDVKRLAVAWTQTQTTRVGKVEAVLGRLAAFEYTTELEASERVRAGADPIEGFLLDTRKGHCEYFASAAALLLREVGVPTRIVNGYYGPRRNRIGDFYALRQADAHAWIEVHFGELGWVTFDPTPVAGRNAGANAPLWPAAAQALDALRNAYLQYVIDYDLGKQIALLESMRGKDAARRDTPTRLPWTLMLPFGVLALWFVVRRLEKLRRPSSLPHVEIYRRLLAELERAGWARTPNESPSHFARRMLARRPRHADAFAEFAATYEAIRFGPATVATDTTELRRLAKAVRTALREGSQAR